MKQTSLIPTSKVISGALAGALTTIIVWGVQQFAKIEIPGEVGAAISTVLTLVVAYITPPGERDTIEEDWR